MHDTIKVTKKKTKKKVKKIDVRDRVRKVDVDALTQEQVANLELQISEKLKDIIDKAVNEANKILNIYGIEACMQISIKPIDKE
jgi:hypothetical protein